MHSPPCPCTAPPPSLPPSRRKVRRTLAPLDKERRAVVAEEAMIRAVLGAMPHLSPSLASGHVLMQGFVDALFCQVGDQQEQRGGMGRPAPALHVCIAGGALRWQYESAQAVWHSVEGVPAAPAARHVRPAQRSGGDAEAARGQR